MREREVISRERKRIGERTSREAEARKAHFDRVHRVTTERTNTFTSKISCGRRESFSNPSLNTYSRVEFVNSLHFLTSHYVTHSLSLHAKSTLFWYHTSLCLSCRLPRLFHFQCSSERLFFRDPLQRSFQNARRSESFCSRPTFSRLADATSWR